MTPPQHQSSIARKLRLEAKNLRASPARGRSWLLRRCLLRSQVLKVRHRPSLGQPRCSAQLPSRASSQQVTVSCVTALSGPRSCAIGQVHVRHVSATRRCGADL